MSFNAPLWSPAEADAILFDWDGVIADTSLDFTEIRHRYFGTRQAMLLEDARTLAPSARESLMRDLHDLEMDGARRAVPVAGSRRVLDMVRSRGIPWAVVSRNCRDSILEAAHRCEVDLPPLVLSRDDSAHVKPDPRALTDACAALGSDPAHTLFIGDYIYDMMGARRAGLRGVLVCASRPSEWTPWLECAHDTMDDLADDIEHVGRHIAWEYMEAAEAIGAERLARNAALAVRVPRAARPDLPTWLASCARLGVGTFVASDDERLSPTEWKESRLFEPRLMGAATAEVVADFLSARFPFARVASGREGTVLPDDALDAAAVLSS